MKKIQDNELLELIHKSDLYSVEKIRHLAEKIKRLDDIITSGYEEENFYISKIFYQLSDINCEIRKRIESGLSAYAAMIEVVNNDYCRLSEAIIAWNYNQLWDYDYRKNVNLAVLDILKGLGLGARTIYNRLNSKGYHYFNYYELLYHWRSMDEPTLFITDKKVLKKNKI